MSEITVSDCIGCGICTTVCANNGINGSPVTFRKELGGSEDFLLKITNGNIKMTDVRLCDNCRTCTEYCPTGATDEVLDILTQMRHNWTRARRRYLER